MVCRPVRNKFEEAVREQGLHIDTIKTIDDNFFNMILKSQLNNDLSTMFLTDDATALVDKIIDIIDELTLYAEIFGISKKELNRLHKLKLEQFGDYTEKIIGAINE